MQTHKIRDPEFEARIARSFALQNAMASLGVTIKRIAAGDVTLTMPFQEAFTQQHGFMHAGAITSVLDSACGYAALSLMPIGAGVLTVEFKTSLLAPAAGERFECRGNVVKSGRTLTFCEGRAYAYDKDNGNEKLIATMVATMMTIKDRDQIAD
jgi:uncharacterized protein (TIGR00369 family)